jgi:predicted RNA-binding protein with PUA-like domain
LLHLFEFGNKVNYWIFQGNPDIFRLNEYLERFDRITWTVRQKHFAEEMKIGDEVFLWRSSGRERTQSGVVGIATIVSTPEKIPEDKEAIPYWKRSDPLRPALRVRLKITRRCLGTKETVKREWLKMEPILREIRILKLPNETNYKITSAEAQRLALLSRNTGRDWNRDESLAALWAFSQTEKNKVSKLPGAPVSIVAQTIGRAIGGVYNKVMNFRAIDPRDKRIGLFATNAVDHEVWAEFYDEKTKALRVDALNSEYQRLWGRSVSTVSTVRISYEDFGEAPDDNTGELQSFARRVRKGQSKFRKKLLQLYEGQCAISGWAPEAVLDAAHISEHSKSGINHSGNGILLRSDLHALMDANLLRIETETCRVVLDSSLQNTPYWEHNGKTLHERTDGSRISNIYLIQRFGHGNNDR